MILLDTSCLIDFFRGSPEAYSCIKGRSYAVTAISEGVRDIATRDSDFLVIAKVTDLNICIY